MKTVRHLGTVAWVLVVVVCCSAPRYLHTRAYPTPGFAARNYAFRAFAQPVTAMSMTAVPLPAEPPLVDPSLPVIKPADNYPKARVYQFSEGRLQILHCAISDIAVRTQRNGHITVSLRADQNPKAVPPLLVSPNVTTEQPPSVNTAQYLRNQFYVRLRCYGKLNGSEPIAELGKPVLADLLVPPFWVERGEPYHLNYTCWSEAIEKQFLFIDRVEVEFTYRLAPDEVAP